MLEPSIVFDSVGGSGSGSKIQNNQDKANERRGWIEAQNQISTDLDVRVSSKSQCLAPPPPRHPDWELVAFSEGGLVMVEEDAQI